MEAKFGKYRSKLPVTILAVHVLVQLLGFACFHCFFFACFILPCVAFVFETSGFFC